MNIQYALVISLIAITFSHNLYADETGVAKVVIMRGQVKGRLSSGAIIDVKIDQSIPEGATLQTAEKSFVKLIFIDKSQMNLGPNSQMIINAFPKKEAGIITLVKGQIRSQVTKDYMEMNDKNKSKLYIKTKTAAMGIRGTDFQVNFNPENQNTALITFEGKVAMAHIEKAGREDSFDQVKLEKVVSSDKAVMVEHGQISAVNLNVAERAMAPTLLGTKQIDALKDNETGMKESTESEKKQYRNPLPPGADSAIFSNVSKEIATFSDSSTKSDPNGFFNAKTGEYKLPAGSIVDLNTVNIIPPPANAVFDPNSKTYVVPESYGKIDKSTGEYKAPEGLKLGADGKFVVVDATAYAKSQVINKEEKKEEKKEDKKEEKKGDLKEDKKDEKKADLKAVDANGVAPKDAGARVPASVETVTAPIGPAPVNMTIPQPLGILPPTFVNTFSPTASQTIKPPTMNICTSCIIDSITQQNNAASNTGTTSPTSKVKIIFNAQ